MLVYLAFMLPAIILSFYAQSKVNRTFKKYSSVKSQRGYTGAEAAGILLRKNGMASEVRVESVAGSLSDHYDPRAHTVRLSQPVYSSNSISAVSVAAHEVGHAIQHNLQYGPLELRSRIVPVTNFASTASFPIIILGFFLQSINLVLVGVILFSLVVAFHLITLPVELNASRRAIVQLSEAGIISSEETPGVKKVLDAAALTYIAATLSALATLFYYLSMFIFSDD